MKLVIILSLVIQNALPQDSARVEAHFKRYKHFQYVNYDSALMHLSRAIEVAEVATSKNKQGELFREKGIFLKDNGKFTESVEALTHAIELFENNPLLQAATYNNLGVTYWRSGDKEKGLSYYLKSRDMNLKLDNKPGLVRNHIALGNYFAVDHQYEKAIDNFDEALGFAATSDRPMYALILKNTGNVYNDKQFSGYNTDKAIEYYQKSLQAYAALKDTVSIAGLHVNIGLIYENQNDLVNSERQYEYAIAMQNRLGLKADLASSYLNLGNVLLKQNLVARAKQSFLHGFDIAASSKNNNNYRNLARKLSTCYVKEKEYQKAYSYFMLYDSLDQLMYNVQTAASIKELETKYGTEKKQAEIDLRTQQRDSIMITLMVALIMTILIVWIYSQRQKAVSQLRERDKTLMDKKVDKLLRDQEIRSLRAYLNGQDQERKRLAEDLHDRLGSTLSATKLYFSAIRESSIDRSQSLEKASQLLDHAVNEVREISQNLLSGAISKFGLQTALNELKDTITDTNSIRMELFVYGLDSRLEGKTEHQLYRIIQELVSNVLKHANATEITIQLNKHDGELTLTVEDNGAGFDHDSTTTSSKGVGLQNVTSRVQSLEGNLLIDSNKGSGTTILINIPIAP